MSWTDGSSAPEFLADFGPFATSTSRCTPCSGRRSPVFSTPTPARLTRRISPRRSTRIPSGGHRPCSRRTSSSRSSRPTGCPRIAARSMACCSSARCGSARSPLFDGATTTAPLRRDAPSARAPPRCAQLQHEEQERKVGQDRAAPVGPRPRGPGPKACRLARPWRLGRAHGSQARPRRSHRPVPSRPEPQRQPPAEEVPPGSGAARASPPPATRRPSDLHLARDRGRCPQGHPRWVTHGPEGDIVDLYTTLPWHTLCEEVARLKIDLETAPKTDLKSVAPDPAKYAKLHERHLQFTYTARNPEQFQEVTKRGGRDLNPRPPP